MNRLRKFSLNNFFKTVLIAVILFIVTQHSQAQRIPPKDFDSLLTKKADTIKPRIVPPKDSVTIIASDTIPINDTIPGSDSIQLLFY